MQINKKQKRKVVLNISNGISSQHKNEQCIISWRSNFNAKWNLHVSHCNAQQATVAQQVIAANECCGKRMSIRLIASSATLLLSPLELGNDHA